MRTILAVVAVALGLFASVGQAAAAPGDSALELAAQAAAGGQAAGAKSGASQSSPTNTNISVRVLSPGDDGDVSQSNSVESGATAANANATGQSAGQAAAGGGGTQAAGQEAKSTQEAAAASAAEQKGAENTNISVRVLSPGKDGKVTQQNTVDSSARAGNLNLTGQDAGQVQGGSGGTQAIGQQSRSDQSATALSAAKQDGAKNRNVPVRVASPGEGGDVTQSNTVGSTATAGNLNATKQQADQGQGGRSACGCASDGTQAIGQEAKNEQSAGALSAAIQSGASNSNSPVRVDSKGDDGDVSQSNSVGSQAKALNIDLTGQTAEQEQGGGDCPCAASGTQAIGQEAKNDQSAAAASLAVQDFGRDRCGCQTGGNSNAPVRVDSYGGGGSVEQSNGVGSSASAVNLNALGQHAEQAQAGNRGIAIQALGQEAKSSQAAIGLSAALQHGASNANGPVAVDAKGGGGSVSQSNDVGSAAKALNANLTHQGATQRQDGGKCGCREDVDVQALGQSAKSTQGALAASLGLQCGARNGPAGMWADGPQPYIRAPSKEVDYC